MFISTAYAMAGQAQAPGQQGNWFTGLIPIILIFAIFYFMLIRPQQKQQKKHKEMLSNLQRGDKVITRGGIHGVIHGVTDKILQVEIAEGVRVKLNREAIAFVERPAEAEAKATEKAN